MSVNYISEKRFLYPTLKTSITTIKTQIIKLKIWAKDLESYKSLEDVQCY